jgi:hypothetical protein
MLVSVTVVFASRKLADVERWAYCFLVEDLVVMVVIKGTQRLLGNVARAGCGGVSPAYNTRTKDKIPDLPVKHRNSGVLVAQRVEFEKDECPRAVAKQHVSVGHFFGKEGIAQGLAEKSPGTPSLNASAKAGE